MPDTRLLSGLQLAIVALVGVIASFAPGTAHAQLDTRHWVPPLWS